MKSTHFVCTFSLYFSAFALGQTLKAQGAEGSQDTIAQESTERTMVPEADVAIPVDADGWSSGRSGAEPEAADVSNHELVKEQDPDNVDIPPAEHLVTAEIDCGTFAGGSSEAIMEAIVMAEAGDGGNFCRVAPGETCSDFDDQLKGYGSLKSSAQSPLFCKFIGH